MAWRSVCDKACRWINIWFTQFRVVGLKNQRPAARGAQGIIIIKIDAIGDFLIWLDRRLLWYAMLFAPISQRIQDFLMK